MAPNAAPRVTVVIPTFNAGRFIDATIASVLAQTAPSLELIVVDDGSSDGTLARAAAFSDPRIQVIRQEHQGSSAAMNLGVTHARGEFVAILDQDDLWCPDKLARHLEIFDQHPEFDLVFSYYRIVDENGGDLGHDKSRGEGVIAFEQLLSGERVAGTSTLVLRRDAVRRAGGFDTRFVCISDLHLVLRVARLRQGNVYCIGEELTSYRQHRNQQSRNWRPVERECLLMLQEFGATGGAALSRRRRWYAFQAYKSGDFAAGCRLCAQALWHAPRFFLADLWSWKISAACLAGLFLPAAILQRLGSRE